MASITRSKKSKPKRSEFQKLWDRADSLRRRNNQFREKLDSLVDRVHNSIEPVERETASSAVALLVKLLRFGQKKSLGQRHRYELDEWIRELTELVGPFDLITETTRNEIARYDAYQMGVELNTDDNAPSPVEQLENFIESETTREEAEAEEEQLLWEAELEKRREALPEEAELIVARKLNKELGLPPKLPEKHAHNNDLLQDELDAELQRAFDLYTEKRTARHAELLPKILAMLQADLDNQSRLDDEFFAFDFDSDIEDYTNEDNFGFDDNDEDDFDFDFGGKQHTSGSHTGAPASPQLTNQTFQRMFRATAAKLHPDREPDADARNEKQTLMVKLLKARKSGDVMTVLDMYQTYTDATESFSKADEKQLLTALRQQIDNLEDEREEIAQQSRMHEMVYIQFYKSSKKKTEQAIATHIAHLKQNKAHFIELTKEIRSLKTLKPWLQKRQEAQIEPADLMDFINDLKARFRHDVDLSDVHF